MQCDNEQLQNFCKIYPRLNVEVMKDEGSVHNDADILYVYRSVAGPRRDVPPFVLSLKQTHDHGEFLSATDIVTRIKLA